MKLARVTHVQYSPDRQKVSDLCREYITNHANYEKNYEGRTESNVHIYPTMKNVSKM